MLNFLCYFVLFNAVKTDKKNNFAPYGENFYYLTYQDKITLVIKCPFQDLKMPGII